MSTFWNEDNPSDFEQLQEDIEDQAQALLDEMEEDEMEEDFEEEEVYMDDYQPNEETAYKLDSRETSVVNESMVRLEQARLYDMLIKHDLFAGVKAHPKALKNVQNELKKYIVERLEILLGIKQEKIQNNEPKQLVVDSPFNDVEIDFLKALSYKGTKGASAGAKKKRLIANEIQPLQQEEEPQGLKPLGMVEEDVETSAVEEEYEEEVVKPKRKTAPKRKVAAKKAPAKPRGRPPKKKPAVAKSTKGITRKRRGDLRADEAEALAREDMERMAGRPKKPVHEMTPKELKALNKKISKGSQRIRPDDAQEIPVGDQLGMHYQRQQSNQSMDPKNNGFNVILQKVLHDKNK